MSKFPENSEMRISQAFSKRVKELMDDNDCASNKDFAKLVGVSFPVITKAVNFGIVPTMKSLIMIADKLELSLLYLLGETNDNDFIGSSMPSTFADRLQELANERNEKFGAISNKMPFIRTYFYNWIKLGTLPSLEYAIEIANYFNVSLDYLFGRSDYRK
jgi:transcriptional regulator with XRE-family HTH domain